MKYKLYTTLLLASLIPSFVFSQQLDESFLKSLPPEVASDLLERSENRNALEETQYRRPSTFIEKPEIESDRFGAQIFSMMQSSLMPLNEPNFDGSYILDFGDELELQLIGQKSSLDKLLIKRDGSININDIGKLNVAGLSLEEAAKLIKTKISQLYIGVEAFVTLTNIRDVQIIMAGNVYNPGSYTLNGNSNIFHALSVSGGPSENGSFRSIDLVRNNKKIETIDLYQTFIYGKSSFSTRLRSGDLIFVNSVENIITLSGAFKRNASYELLEGETLSSAIRFGDGLSAFADLKNISLERILDGKIKILPITNISQFKDIIANDGDKIFIRVFPFRSIEVSGAVINPGTYLMNDGDTVNDALAKAGGYTDSAYLFGAVYENRIAKLINEDALDQLYENSINSIAESIKQTGSEIDFTPLITILNELKDIEPSGRVVIDLNRTDSNSMRIQDKDYLLIPEITNQVYLYGAISSSGSALFKEDADLIYYLNKKGGLLEKADKNAVYVMQPNGETIHIKMNKNIFKKQVEEVKLYPGSIIYIPEEINTGYSSMLKTQAYATILGNIGVSLASISVLKD